MNKAPKKIWVDKDYLTVGFERIDDRDTLYIRVDIVDELVEAAEGLLRSLDWDSEVQEKNWWFEARAKARAALKKLEEE